MADKRKEESVIAAQREFRNSIGMIPFQTASELKRKPHGRCRRARTLENIYSEKTAHSALGLSDLPARIILHIDLYKLTVVQELQRRENRMASCDIIPNVSTNVVLFTSHKAHFHISGCVNKISLLGRKWP